MNGIDNENISVNELLDFLTSVSEKKAICPKCNKSLLKFNDFYVSKFKPETYMRGRDESFLYAEISCECGFENCFNSLWCRKGIDGKSKKKYRVGLAVGGVMEKPEFTYENIQEIEAYSPKDAIKKYNKMNGNNYWSATIVESN